MAIVADAGEHEIDDGGSPAIDFKSSVARRAACSRSGSSPCMRWMRAAGTRAGTSNSLDASAKFESG